MILSTFLASLFPERCLGSARIAYVAWLIAGFHGSFGKPSRETVAAIRLPYETSGSHQCNDWVAVKELK